MPLLRRLRAKLGQRRALALVALLFAAGYFSYYGISNDHFDRLARARQIAVYGDVPFRDFFDPGYFLNLYASALLMRLFGDRLLGEVLLNLSFMVAGTIIVFRLAERASQSTGYGAVAAALVVAGQPRPYDFDKILFYPLGLWACWAYIDRPTIKSLLILSAVTVLAGLFRYDSGVYLGAAALVGIVVTHWADWRTAARRAALLCAAMALMTAPALIFIQSTAGLSDAFAQVTTYAEREGERSRIFVPAPLTIDWTSPHGVLNTDNAVAWLYGLAYVLPLAVVLISLCAARNRRPAQMARLLSLAAMAWLVALFILRDPLVAHLPGDLPLIVIAGGVLTGECVQWLRDSRAATRGTSRRLAMAARGWVIGSGGVALLAGVVMSIGVLLYVPPEKNFEFTRRLRMYAHSPVPLELLPKSAMEPLVEYLRSCTHEQDRVLVAWFAPEVNVIAGRGFAGGLPVIFGQHWIDLPYQRRAIQKLEQESVPIVVTSVERPIEGYEFLWDYVTTHYDRAYEGQLLASPPLQIWVKHDLAVERSYPPYALPCYVAQSATAALR